MAPEKEPIKISDKIKKSTIKRGAIMDMLGLKKNKFAVKMKYNDWDEKEKSILRKHKIID